jgi:hypothetical protein
MFSGGKHKIVICAAHLQPESGGFSEKTHTHVMRKWVWLSCPPNDQSALVLTAVSLAIVFVARAIDLRVIATLLTSIGLYREKPLSSRRVGRLEFNSVGFQELGALSRRPLPHPSGLASALLDPLWRLSRHRAGE